MTSPIINVVIAIVCSILVVTTSSQKTSPVQQIGAVQGTDICRQLCIKMYSCPTECMGIYSAKAKRLGGIEGLTFDDYIFMRLLGRDTAHRKHY